jgi:uncharacterized membrane protein
MSRPEAPPVSNAAPADARRRIVSIDILRGIVIVLMVLDHVRDFLHIDANGDPLDPQHTTALLYATRWVTHFCAPTFVLLAGVSAWLQRARGKGTRELSLFLVTRGLWLVLLELTVIDFGLSFSLPYFFFMQVIWVIGWSMVALAGAVWLPRAAVLVLGVLILLTHNLLDPIKPEQWGAYANLWSALHVSEVWTYHGEPVAFLAYPFLPWFGVMLFGYGIGPLFLAPEGRRDRAFVALGLAMMAAFLVLRFLNGYGDPHPWSSQATLAQTVMDFLRVEKYPPSLMYVCATLGPVLAVIPLVERWRGRAARVFLLFGSVPFFAYVVHIYIVHAWAILLRLATGQSPAFFFDMMRHIVGPPDAFAPTGFSLGVVYLSWLGVLALLYPLCRWYAGLRRRRQDWWLSYL